MRFIPYLSFKGDCREAFEFYARTLDGEIKDMIAHGDTPAGDSVSKEWQDKIINAYLVADGAEIMGADTPPEMGDSAPRGFSLSIQLDGDQEERAQRIFDAFSNGGTVLMQLAPTFWAKKFGMVTDRYGTPWMINCGQLQQ